MTVATLTNKAVTAILKASSSQNANSADTKWISGKAGSVYACRLTAATAPFNCSTNGNASVGRFKAVGSGEPVSRNAASRNPASRKPSVTKTQHHETVRHETLRRLRVLRPAAFAAGQAA